MEEDITSRRKCHIYTGTAEWKYFPFAQNEHNLSFFFFYKAAFPNLPGVSRAEQAPHNRDLEHFASRLCPTESSPAPPSPSHFWGPSLILLLLLKTDSNTHIRTPIAGDLRMQGREEMSHSLKIWPANTLLAGVFGRVRHSEHAKCSLSIRYSKDVPSLPRAGCFQDLSKVHLLCLLPTGALSLIRIFFPIFLAYMVCNCRLIL